MQLRLLRVPDPTPPILPSSNFSEILSKLLSNSFDVSVQSGDLDSALDSFWPKQFAFVVQVRQETVSGAAAAREGARALLAYVPSRPAQDAALVGVIYHSP